MISDICLNYFQQEEPFVQLKPDHYDRKGNDRYEGYCIDLLKATAAMLGFQYQIYLVPDGQFGDKNPDGSWNGLVGELMNGVSAIWLLCQGWYHSWK